MALPPSVTGALRFGVAAGVLALVVSRVGAAPFRDAVTHTTAGAVVVALVVESAVTVACARRWVLVARALGLPLEAREATAACFRAQLLNVTLPGGVLGDVQRAWRHGTRVEARGRAARAVVWERAAGFAALVLVTAVVVLVEPSPLRGGSTSRLVAGALVGLAVAGVLVVRRRAASPRLGVLAAEAGALRRAGVLPAVGALSVAAVLGHLLVMVTALRAVGVDLGTAQALPLLAVVLLASTLPANLAGWGPREGAAALLFAAAGLGAATGVTVAAVHGVLTLVAALPGAAVLVQRPAPVRAGVPT
ncbi:lysylphosphatidylglycerol synthase domain-containing protein [Phycicoccus avicenniae]|uniref:lysylphosphatidylglycerol synthase domain-containing protein n=1 Tax=Phycicoccus avicenniae TaxID=2828860 RepID=UPI003D27C925